MPSQISEVQPEILSEQIVPAFVAMLDDAPPLEDPAELEQLAALMLIPLEQPEVPAEVATAVLEAIETRRDANAAGVLAAFGVLAAERLAARAHKSVERLAGEGIVSRAAAAVGTLAVQEAVRIESASAELLVVLLARPGAREVQAAILGIEHLDTGGARARARGLQADAADPGQRGARAAGSRRRCSRAAADHGRGAGGSCPRRGTTSGRSGDRARAQLRGPHCRSSLAR